MIIDETFNYTPKKAINEQQYGEQSLKKYVQVMIRG